MTSYESYIKGVLDGSIITSLYIKQQVKRLEGFKYNHPDYYFDKEEADKCIQFFSLMKHFLGKAANQPFILEPWQAWLVSSIVGIKWKKDKTRVCRELFVMMARKQGKSSLIAGLSLYMMLADGEASPEIACVASSREQANIIFNMVKQYAASLDPDHKTLVPYRNYLKCPANIGQVKVFSSDSARLDGLNISFGILDEGHAQKNNQLYQVLHSSMGMRKQPLMVQITTAGFLLEGYPCFETYKMSIELLADVKKDDSFFPFLYVLDPEDDWTDERNWIKSNPNLGVTVTEEFLRGEVQKAKNDSTQEVAIKTKSFNIWCQAASVWIPQTTVAKCMQSVNLEDYAGETAYLSADLSSVNDLTALSIMIPRADNKFIYKTWCWIPKDTYENSPNREIYKNFVQDGSLELTNGNVVDYDVVINKMAELANQFYISGVYFDPWNASQWQITCTELGYNMVPISQSFAGMSGPTKELAKHLLSEDVIIDKNRCVLWSFGNALPKQDYNGNQKLVKDSLNKKIDPVVSMVLAMAGWVKNPIETNFDIIII